MSRRLIITHATAATVVGWATRGPKRLRAKYRNAVIACRVLNRRESPLVGLDAAGAFGPIAALKFAWGTGFIGRAIPEWSNRERSRNWCRRHGNGPPGFGLGWYGAYHAQYGGLTMALHSRADLRTWARRGFPTSSPTFFRAASCITNTESRRRLLGRGRQ